MLRGISRILLAGLVVIPSSALTFDDGRADSSPLFGMRWDLLLGGGNSIVFIDEDWIDLRLGQRVVRSNWESSGVATVRMQGWRNFFGMDLGMSFERGETRFAGLLCARRPRDGWEPFVGIGLQYASRMITYSGRSGGLSREEFDLIASLGARLFTGRAPFIFVETRYLRGGNFYLYWPQGGNWHRRSTIHFLGGFGIAL